MTTSTPDPHRTNETPAPPHAAVTLREVTGRDDLALVYLLQLGSDPSRLVETVDSLDPRYPRADKTVIIISTQLGCPVGCLMCDAGTRFVGDLTADEMLGQVRFVLERRAEILGSRKLKVHFARMGEPALNADNVLDALERLPALLPSASLLPAIATAAPAGTEPFFERLAELRDRVYAHRAFQLQFSINTTDAEVRRELMPARLLSLEEIAACGGRFWRAGDRKVVLNFALAAGLPVDAELLARTFDPERFVIKLTPVNPTDRALANTLDTVVDAAHPEAADKLVEALHAAGFDAIVSIGEPDEIAIGSNCGQLVRRAQWAQG